MEEVIEHGFSRLVELINTKSTQIDSYTEEIRQMDADLLSRMAALIKHLIEKIGIQMLEKGKNDNQGEIYDPQYYNTRMILLGKSSEPVQFRPDNMSKKVSDQFCALSEDGKFYEIMYSTDGFIIDSYRCELTSRQVIDLYGYDALFMLYKALEQYLENQESILAVLEKAISFIETGV